MPKRLPSFLPHRFALSLGRGVGLATAAVLLTWSAGCSNTINRAMSEGITGIVTPYRVEIVQGNVVTREQLAQVKPGMPRNQVKAVLGTPLLADPLHANRWDYVFAIRRQGTEPQMRAIVVHFEGDAVKSVDAPEALPTEIEFVASISRPFSGEPRPLALTPEQVAALPLPAPQADAAASAPLGATRTYPPLER